MTEFILEEQINNVVNKNTKKYLKEVLSCYNNGNYRATVVVLYTIVIYDILQKLVILREIYNDKNASDILNEIKEQQKKNPKSPEWEGDLIDDVCEKTNLITPVEKEELLHLKNERNYAAHPIINIIDEDETLVLKKITKETAKDLIRKSFEIVFLKDAILARKITNDFVSELNEFYGRIGVGGLESHLGKKFFSRMTQSSKDDLFKSLWKFVFFLNNEDCRENRLSNYWGLVFLYKTNKNHYEKIISENDTIYFDKLTFEHISDYTSVEEKDIGWFEIAVNIDNMRISSFIKFLEEFPEIYKILNDYAKNIVFESINNIFVSCDVEQQIMNGYHRGAVEEKIRMKARAVFLSTNVEDHFNKIFKMISNFISTQNSVSYINDYAILRKDDIQVIFNQCEYRGCINEFLDFLIEYCGGAMQFNQTNNLFDILKNYFKYFNEGHYFMILVKMNSNSQFYNNRETGYYIKELEKSFKKQFNKGLISNNEEKYLLNNLFKVEDEVDLSTVLKLIEDRAQYFSGYELICLLDTIYYSDDSYFKGRKIDDFPNIFRNISNKSDISYRERNMNTLKNYFENN